MQAPLTIVPSMYRLSTGAKVGSIVLIGLQICGWCIALAGLAALTDYCNKGIDDAHLSSVIFGLGPNLLSGGDPDAYDCGIQYSWYWWVIALQFACVVAGLIGAFSSNAGRLATASLYNIASTLWCIFCYAMVSQAYLYKEDLGSDGNDWGKAYTAAAAGAIVVATCNFLFLIVYGTEYVPASEHTKAPQHNDGPAAPTGFTAA